MISLMLRSADLVIALLPAALGLGCLLFLWLALREDR